MISLINHDSSEGEQWGRYNFTQNKDPYNGYYKSLWTIGWLAPINGY